MAIASDDEQQVRRIILDDIVNGEAGKSVLKLSSEIIQGAKREFDEEARLISEQRAALERVFTSM